MSVGIYGAGGHTKAVYDIAKKYKDISFFDEKKKFFKIEGKVFKIYGGIKQLLSNKKKFSKVFVSLGDNDQRKKIYQILKKENFEFISLKHPNSYFASGSKIGNGSVIMPGCTIQSETKIGNNCIINTSVSIDHECIIGDHTHISPGVIMGGNIKIGKNCWIGLGTKIIPNLIIGDNVQVAAGSLVVKHIKSNSFVKGTPAKNATKRLA